MIQQQLKTLRLAAGFSQTELGAKLGNGGYNKQTVSAIENGHRIVGLALLNDWAAACGKKVVISFK